MLERNPNKDNNSEILCSDRTKPKSSLARRPKPKIRQTTSPSSLTWEKNFGVVRNEKKRIRSRGKELERGAGAGCATIQGLDSGTRGVKRKQSGRLPERNCRWRGILFLRQRARIIATSRTVAESWTWERRGVAKLSICQVLRN